MTKRLGGQVITGAVVSFTETADVQVARFPESSTAVYVIELRISLI